MAIHIDEDNLKSGVLGLVVALVEIIRDALRIQALNRMDGGSLTENECERLGAALLALDAALEDLKQDLNIAESVRSVRQGLDEVVDEVVNGLINPERWLESEDCQEVGRRATGSLANKREPVGTGSLASLFGEAKNAV